MKKPQLRTEASAVAEHAAVVPARKLSETLFAFGEPLFSLLGEDAPLPVRQQSMQLVITAWNAGAMAMPEWGKPELLRQFEQMLTQHATALPMTDVLRQLLVRRRELFGSDPRAVGDWALIPQPDATYVLRCEAHLPTGSTHARLEQVEAGRS